MLRLHTLRLQKINPLCDEPLSHASTQCTKNRGWGHLRMVVVTALCPYKDMANWEYVANGTRPGVGCLKVLGV